MSETFTPTQIAKETKSAYLAGEYTSENHTIGTVRKGHLSANNPPITTAMANNCCRARLKSCVNQVTLEALILIKEADQNYWNNFEIIKELGGIELRLSLIHSISSIQLRVCPEITSEFLSDPTGQTLSIVRMERIVNSEVKNGQCLSTVCQFLAADSMYTGIQSFEKPTLKHILGFPIQLLNNISIELTNGINCNP